MLQSRLKTYEITLLKPRRKFSVEIFVSRCKIKSLPLLLHQEKLVCSSPPFRFFFFFFSSRFRFWRGASAQKRMSNLVNWMKLRRGRERRLGGEAVFQGNLVLIFYTSRTPRDCVYVCMYREGSERRMEERSPPLPADLLRWMKSRNGRVLREAGTGVQRVFFFERFVHPSHVSRDSRAILWSFIFRAVELEEEEESSAKILRMLWNLKYN